MKVHGIDHFNVRASREMLERTRQFYCDVIGLVVGDRPPFEESGYWLYAGEHAVVHLSQARDTERLATDVATTLNHVAFACQGRTEFEQRLTDFGIDYRTAEVPATSVSQIFTNDPAGTGIELSFGDEA